MLNRTPDDSGKILPKGKVEGEVLWSSRFGTTTGRPLVSNAQNHMARNFSLNHRNAQLSGSTRKITLRIYRSWLRIILVRNSSPFVRFIASIIPCRTFQNTGSLREVGRIGILEVMLHVVTLVLKWNFLFFLRMSLHAS